MTDIVPDDQIDGGPIDKGPPVLTAAEQQLAFAREERDWYEAGREKALARGAAMETALIERSKELERMRAVVAKVRALRSSLATMPFSEPIATVIVRLDEALAEDSA